MMTHRRILVGFLACLALLLRATTPDARGLDVRVADAAMQEDAAAVTALLQQGADVNAPQGDGMTALHWAAEHGDPALTARLLGAGASPGAGTRIGRHTPLHLAARGGHDRVVRLLVDAKADVGAPTTTGAAPLHFAAASGSRDAVAILLDAGADVNVREPQWGQTPLMFAAASGRTDVVRTLLARGADARATAKVVDISARNREDSAESRARNARVAQIQKELAAAKARAATPGSAPAPRAARGRGGDTDGNEPEPLGYADLVGAQGGLTALLLASREGLGETAFALIDGGADINQVSASDHTSPLLMAAINGHFDLAMRLLARGADPTRASDAGGTPLYGVLNMQWAPKARHPQPAHYMQQTIGYLDLAEALLKAGADPNARLRKSLWYTTYNRDLLSVDRTGSTPFWWAAYTLDVPAMKLLLAYGADPSLGTAKARVAWQRGPSDPSMLSGRPTTKPAMCSRTVKAFSCSMSLVNFVRRTVSAGPAKCQPASQMARPTVFVPMSRPASLPPGTAVANSRGSDVISAAMLAASAPHRPGSRPRTARNHRRDNCCPAARRGRAAAHRRRRAAGPCRNAPSGR